MQTSILRVFLLLSCIGPLATAQLPEVLYLPFDGGQPPQDINLADPGTPMFLAPGTYLYDTGMVGSALDSSAGAVRIFGNFEVESDWTLEFWARSDFPVPGPSTIHTETLLAGSDFEVSITATTNSPRTLKIHLSNNLIGITLSFGSMPIGSWHHAAVSYDQKANELRHYFDGNLVGTLTPETYVSLRAPSFLDIGKFLSSTALPWNGRIDELRIWSRTRSAVEIATHSSTAMQPLSLDLRLQELVAPRAPVACDRLSTTEQLQVTLESFGTATIPAGTAFTWSYTVDGGPTVVETDTLSAPLAPGDFLTFSFATAADLSVPKVHILDVGCSAVVGGNMSTTSKEFRVSGGGPGAIYSFPWVETFPPKALPLTFSPAALPAGWDSATLGAGLQTAGTLTYPPALQTSHTDSSSFYIDSGLSYQLPGSPSPTGEQLVLMPCMDFANLTDPALGCWFESNNPFPGTGNLVVDVHDLDSGLWTFGIAIKPIPTGTSAWNLLTSDLSAYAARRVQIRLRWAMGINMTLDDFTVVDLSIQGQGQAPQADLAEFEINYSFGSGHDRPRSQDAGPYFAETRSGDLIHFQFRGEPNQWIALFWGALNPASINYGPIGLCDVGTGYDFATGLPANIWVIANGFAPTQPIDFLFKTDINGDLFLSTLTPPLPLGSNGAFQSLFTTTNGNWFALSNAVELMVR